MKYGMVIDLEKCVGCNACTVACKQYNATPSGILYNKVLEYEVGKFPAAKLKFKPILCMHCDDPPCLKVCPTLATQKREDGIVVIDNEKCIGCRACIVACPYEVRAYIWELGSYYKGQERTPFEVFKQGKYQPGTVTKCNFCLDRVTEGLEPACVQTCPASARVFGDLSDPKSEISQLITLKGAKEYRTEYNTKPSVFYING